MGFLTEKLKKIKREQWLLLLLVGILLMVAAIPDKKTNNLSPQKENETEIADTENISQMEKKLEDILSNLRGAGNVRVMITQEESTEKIVEKDMPVASQETTVYVKDGSGAEIPYVNKEIAPRIRGVLVLAQGGDNPVIASDITDAIMALFNIEAHKIKVMKMK